jgi:hypothetical protein
MTDRTTKTELDFTEKQVVDALRTAGWTIPDPAVENVNVVVDGARYKVRWKTDVAEPTP